MSNEATKTIADFKEKLAKEYEWPTWQKLMSDETINCTKHLPMSPLDHAEVIEEYCDEAAELYAQYRYEQGRQEGESEAYKQGKQEGFKEGHAEGWHDGWNEALHWAAEHAKADYKGMAQVWIDKQSILNGLKEE